MRKTVLATVLMIGSLSPLSSAMAGDAMGERALQQAAERGRRLFEAQQAADPIARSVALALSDPALRVQLRDALRDSGYTEHKLAFQPFVQTRTGKRLVSSVAKAGGFSSEDLRTRIGSLPKLDLYLPFREHRRTWKATPDILVAAVYDQDAPEIVAYDVKGQPRTLHLADGVPASPLLTLQLEEPKSVTARAPSRGEVVEDPREREPVEKVSSGYTSQSGYFLYHYNIQEGDGWAGDLEMEFRSYYNDPWSTSQLWVLVQNGVEEDQGYNVNLLLNPLPGANGIGDQFTMEIWEMDGGLNGGDDDYGQNWYPPSPLNSIHEYRKFDQFSGTSRSAWIGITRRQFSYSGATGNPFEYSSVNEQSLACYGIASYSPLVCGNIVDFNDRQMCSGLASISQTPCTQITDRNLQLACYGMSIKYSSNCRDITDPNLRRFCYGVSGTNVAQCASIVEANAWALCHAMVTGNDAYCESITNANDLYFCLAVTNHDSGYCGIIGR